MDCLNAERNRKHFHFQHDQTFSTFNIDPACFTPMIQMKMKMIQLCHTKSCTKNAP